MRPHVVFRYVGVTLLFASVFLFISAFLSLLCRDSALYPLLYGGLISALFGVFPLVFVPAVGEISNKEGFVIVVSSWLLVCLGGLIPYVLWGGEFTVTNAWFESVSGFTTTGSSILTEIESLPAGLLFWRASTHFIGGIGIIVFALSVLPSMGRAGMVLYRAEMSPLAAQNFHYRTRRALQVLVVIYAGLTLAETLALVVCGMNLFDAVTHAFATIATGGFSVRNASLAAYRSPSIEIVVMIFMVLSGLHFGLLFSAFRGDVSRLWQSPVVRWYLAALAAGTGLVTLSVHGQGGQAWLETLRYAAFQVISLGTSTGFATVDTAAWPFFAQLVLVFFTLQCACAGSTSGGIKVDRMVLFAKAVLKRLSLIRQPRVVVSLKVDGSAIEADALEAALVYMLLYLTVVFLSALLLTAMGVDSLSAFSGSAAAMGNVGPGFGSVSSMGNFGGIPAAGKWVLTATMLLGRLEIFGLLLFLSARSWR